MKYSTLPLLYLSHVNDYTTFTLLSSGCLYFIRAQIKMKLINI